MRTSTTFRPWTEADWSEHSESRSGRLGASPLDPVDVVTFPWEWKSARLGVQDPALVPQMRESGFDHAPVHLPESDVGWGLVAIQQLEDLAATGNPLDSTHVDAECLIPLEPGNDIDFGEWLSLECLLRFLARKPAGFIGFRYPNPGLSESELAHRLDPRRLSSKLPVTYSNPLSERGHIVGLVTRSDLNRPAVAQIMYEKFFALERRISRTIASEHLDVSEWIGMLNEEAQAHVLGWWEVARRKGLDIGPLVSLTLPQLIQIVRKSTKVRGRLGFKSGNAVDDALGGLVSVRNRIMHPTRPLVTSAEEVEGLLDAAAVASAIAEGRKLS